MKMMKKITASLLGVAVLLSHGGVTIADSISGSFAGLPAMTLSIVDAPIKVYEDFSFEVSTNDGSNIGNALADYHLGFSIVGPAGTESAYSLEDVNEELYTLEVGGDTLRVNLDVTAEGENSVSISPGFPPVVTALSFPFMAGESYTLKFGSYNPMTRTVESFMSVPVRIVAAPVSLTVFPEGDVEPGTEVIFVVRNGEGRATTLPGNYYLAVFNLDGFVNVGTSIDGRVSAVRFFPGMYKFTVPEAGRYRVSMGPKALVQRVDSKEFDVVAAADVNVGPEFNWGAFDLNDVVINPLEVPSLLITPTGIVVSEGPYVVGGKVNVKLTKTIEGQVLNVNLPEGWDVDVWFDAPDADPVKSLSYLDGDFEPANLGYDFEIPNVSGIYSVRLLNASGSLVAKSPLMVESQNQNFDLGNPLPNPDDLALNLDGFLDQNGVGQNNQNGLNFDLGGVFFDPEDIVLDLDGFRERNGVVNGNQGREVFVCGDMNQDYWGYEVVNNLLAEGLFPVIIDNVAVNCRPNTEVKRKEFTVWLLNAYRADALVDIEAFHGNYNYANSPFSDVNGDDPYDPYIILANQFGIVSGNPDGTFRPNNTINRAEVLKILLRSSEIFLATEGEISSLNSADNPIVKFVDESRNDWYTPYLHYAVGVEIIEGRTVNGVRMAAMGDGVLFGEAAKILYLARELSR